MTEAKDLVLSGPSFVPEGKVGHAVVFFHGYGANGHDLYGLSSFLKWSFPDTAFYFPNAPEPVFGAEIFGGRQWFDLSAYNPSDMESDKSALEKFCRSVLPAAERARKYTDRFVTQVREIHGLEASDTAIAGFSQGGMMALLTALKYPQKVAAVVGMSALPVVFDDKFFPLADVVSKPDVTLTHGDADDVVPLPAYLLNLENMDKAGVPAAGFVVEELMHGIDETVMFHLKSALRAGFGIGQGLSEGG